jgi:hypothetical protein
MRDYSRQLFFRWVRATDKIPAHTCFTNGWILNRGYVVPFMNSSPLPIATTTLSSHSGRELTTACGVLGGTGQPLAGVVSGVTICEVGMIGKP